MDTTYPDFSIIQDRYKAVSVALNQAAFKYQVALIDYKTGPEVINSREVYLRHVKEHQEIKEKMIAYQDHLYSESLKKINSLKSKSKK
jgi:hypothetical protein